jgi:PAS domain S-box-containing protein
MNPEHPKCPGEEWRKKAEARLEELNEVPLEPTDLARLVHEMRVHQVELELQNEDLIETRSKLEDSAETLTEIYDFAPVGYFSLTPSGHVRKLNFKGAGMLGLERAKARGRILAEFVALDDRPAFGRFLASVLCGGESEVCEVKLSRQGRADVILSLTGSLAPGGRIFRIAAMDVTEQRRVEAAAHEKHEDLERIFNLSHDLLAIAGNEGRFHRVNPAFERVLGYSLEHLTSCDFLAFVHPDDRDATLAAMDSLRAGKEVMDFTNRYLCADGSYCWLEWRATPYGDGLQCCLARDITARKKAESALRESEERLRLFIAHAPMGIAMFDREMRYIAASDRWRLSYGLKGDVIGLCHYDLLPDMPENWREAHCRGLNGESLKQDEDFFVRPDGSPCWIKWDLRPWYLSDGQVGGILIGVEDITASKQAADALRRSEEKFRSMVESSPTAMYLYQLGDDGGLYLTDANQAADRELGVSHAGLIGKPLEQAFPGLVETGVPAMYAAVAKGELGIQKFEIGYDHSGIFGYYDVTVFQTNPGTIAVIFMDISERRKVQLALEKNQEELEAQVQKRTELLKARTLQLRALAVDLSYAEEREQRRIANLIHEDLQQNLVAALVNLGLLKSRFTGQAEVEEFSHIEGILKDAVTTARSLTSELSPPVLQQCGLAAALKWLRTWCGEKYAMDVTVEVEEGADPNPEVSVSLFRCVRELLFNIVKHAGVREAGLRMWKTDEDIVKIEVSDAGCGFDPDEVRAREGSVGGFGLFSIRERLEWLGGGFEIDSSPGEGSRLTLWVPLKIA